jgi:hypothetical protein
MKKLSLLVFTIFVMMPGSTIASAELLNAQQDQIKAQDRVLEQQREDAIKMGQQISPDYERERI